MFLPCSACSRLYCAFTQSGSSATYLWALFLCARSHLRAHTDSPARWADLPALSLNLHLCKRQQPHLSWSALPPQSVLLDCFRMTPPPHSPCQGTPGLHHPCYPHLLTQTSLFTHLLPELLLQAAVFSSARAWTCHWRQHRVEVLQHGTCAETMGH